MKRYTFSPTQLTQVEVMNRVFKVSKKPLAAQHTDDLTERI